MELVHAVIPGRNRFRLERMRSSPLAVQAAEEAARSVPGVLSASGSPLTATILVTFQVGETDTEQIQLRLQSVESGPLPQLHSGSGAESLAPSAHAPAKRTSSRMRVPGSRRRGPDLPVLAWSSLAPEEVTTQLQTLGSQGLAAAQASRRLARYGRNAIPDIPRRPRSAILREQLVSVPGLMLGAAAGFSAVTGAGLDAAFIGGALVANAALGFYTEDYAERTIQSLRQVRHPQARVLRDGRRTKINIEDVVVGDILLLEPGHVVAADGRVLRSENLVMDESLLTGESIGQPKQVEALPADSSEEAARANMIFAGSAVMSGKGAAVVTATGMRSQLGRIRSLIGEAPDTPPPMSRELQKLGGTLALLSVGVCGAFGLLGLAMGLPALEVLTIMASLAVSAIPEGLPTVATTTLALGMKRMRSQNVVIRRLPAVAALGSATVVCLDKTGTLTENRMTVRCFILASGETELALAADGVSVRCIRQGDMVSLQDDGLLLAALEIGALCSEADLVRLPDGLWDATGSATEQALLLTAVNSGVDVPRLRAEMQLKSIQERASGRNYMISVYGRLDGGSDVLVKGAPEEVLALCGGERTETGARSFARGRIQQIQKQNEVLASRGMRVLGLASCRLQAGEEWNGIHPKLCWLGLVGMEDPVRTEARDAVAQLSRAGIKTMMLTGDQRSTAAAVGAAVGLGNGGEVRVADASAIEEALASGLPLPDVLARISPSDKYNIVRLLQQRGHVVMMTGDGVNDAPALKAADVGVAMGVRSTQIARDIAHVILLDDNLTSIPLAVSQGRAIYSNIRKSLRFLLASNMSDVGLVAASLVFRLPFPLTALHLLWMNLVTDVFPAIALAVEQAEPGIMDAPPRPPQEPILSKTLTGLVSREAGAIAAGTFGTYLWALSRYGGGARSRTVAFSTITMSQIAYALSCRSENRPFQLSGSGPNPYLLYCLGISAAAQFATVVFPPLRFLLGTVPLALEDWLAVALGSGAVLAGCEAMKLAPHNGSQLDAGQQRGLNAAPAILGPGLQQ